MDNLVTDFSHWDRFDRPISNIWYGNTPTTNIFQLTISYDRNGGIYGVTDDLKMNASGNRNYDVLYSNDDLGRLIRAEEGTLSGTISNRSRDERWQDGSGNSSLTQTGNWGRIRRDLDGIGNFTGTGEMDDTRVHNLANELSTRDTDSNSSVNYTLAYDAAGNMTDDGNDYQGYIYDAFGRLRKVCKNSNGTGLTGEYGYNGLNMKIGWHYDSTRNGGGAPDGTVDSNDPWYYTCYSEKWQGVTVFRGSDSNAKERYIYHTAGLDGIGPGSYIDRTVLIDADVNSGWTSAADSTKEIRRYYLHNLRHDVVALLTSGGALIESDKYLSYGTPFGFAAGDTDSDGDFDAGDDSAISGYSSGYEIRFDPNLDGSIDAADVTYATGIKGSYQALGSKVLSSSVIFNRKGYAGYELAPELAGSKYHVRNRMLDSELGRWTRRDPLGYVDGPSFYEYVRSSPLFACDPLGLDMCGICTTLVHGLEVLGCGYWAHARCVALGLAAPGFGLIICEAIVGLACEMIAEGVLDPHVICERIGLCHHPVPPNVPPTLPPRPRPGFPNPLEWRPEHFFLLNYPCKCCAKLDTSMPTDRSMPICGCYAQLLSNGEACMQCADPVERMSCVARSREQYRQCFQHCLDTICPDCYWPWKRHSGHGGT